MKYGIYYAYWETQWEADYVPYVDKVARLGLDALEIGAKPLPDYSKAQIVALRERAKARGITLTAGYGPSFDHNIGSSDKKIRENATEWFRRLFDVMGQLEIRHLGGALYSYWPIDFTKPVCKEEDWKYSVEGMRIMADLAKPYGIQLGMEVLNRFENHLLNTAEEGVRFVKEVDKENVRLMLDTFHMNIEEDDLLQAILETGDLLGHFHVGERNRKPPGSTNSLPWKEMAGALRQIGYQGAVVMEPFVLMGGSIPYDIKVWRDLSGGASEAELDRMAGDACAFLKKLFA